MAANDGRAWSRVRDADRDCTNSLNFLFQQSGHGCPDTDTYPRACFGLRSEFASLSHRRIGSGATVRFPDPKHRFLVPRRAEPAGRLARLCGRRSTAAPVDAVTRAELQSRSAVPAAIPTFQRGIRSAPAWRLASRAAEARGQAARAEVALTAKSRPSAAC